MSASREDLEAFLAEIDYWYANPEAPEGPQEFEVRLVADE